MHITLALLSFVVALTVTILSMKPLMSSAHKLGLVAEPGGRREHAERTPQTGGMTMAIGLIVAIAVVVLVGWLAQRFFFVNEVVPYQSFIGVAGGAAILLVTGILDDRFELSFLPKAALQSLAALIAIVGFDAEIYTLGNLLGFGEINFVAWGIDWFATLFSVFAIVGAINAINMLDGIDGLASSVVLQILLLVLGLAYSLGYSLALPLIAPIVGVVLGFWLFNVRIGRPRAHVFMGDAGSMLLGYLVALVVIRYGQSPRAVYPPVLALWILWVPVLDTLSLIIRRLARGQSPFTAGRDHVHHLLMKMGLSVNATVLLLVLINLGMAMLGWYLHQLGCADYVLFYIWLAILLLHTAMGRRQKKRHG